MKAQQTVLDISDLRDDVFSAINLESPVTISDEVTGKEFTDAFNQKRGRSFVPFPSPGEPADAILREEGTKEVFLQITEAVELIMRIYESA